MITSGKMGWVCPVCGAGNNPENKLCAAACWQANKNMEAEYKAVAQKEEQMRQQAVRAVYDPMKTAYGDGFGSVLDNRTY